MLPIRIVVLVRLSSLAWSHGGPAGSTGRPVPSRPGSQLPWVVLCGVWPRPVLASCVAVIRIDVATSPPAALSVAVSSGHALKELSVNPI